MALETVGGYAAKGLMLSVEPEDEGGRARGAGARVGGSLRAGVSGGVSAASGDDQIDDAVQRMVDSMDVLGGSAARRRRLKTRLLGRFFPQREGSGFFDAENAAAGQARGFRDGNPYTFYGIIAL